MNQHLIIGVILNCEGDVYRDIAMSPKASLADLHQAIVSAFSMEAGQMAAFYTTDNDWNQLDEIPLMSMDIDAQADMTSSLIATHFTNKQGRLIYIYDFMDMWTFMVEQVRWADGDLPVNPVVLSEGNKPEQAPDPDFESDNLAGDSFDEEAFNDDPYGDEVDPMDPYADL